jgi:hypothetical protein
MTWANGMLDIFRQALKFTNNLEINWLRLTEPLGRGY